MQASFYAVFPIHRLLISEKLTPAIEWFLPIPGKLIRVVDCAPSELERAKHFWAHLRVHGDWFIAHPSLVHWAGSFEKISSLPHIDMSTLETSTREDIPIKLNECRNVLEIGHTYGQLRRWTRIGARSTSGHTVKLATVQTPNGSATTINMYRNFLTELQS